MAEPERLGPDHETAVLEAYDRRLGMYALFDELMEYVDLGKCTFEQAVAQYKHDFNHSNDPQPTL